MRVKSYYSCPTPRPVSRVLACLVRGTLLDPEDTMTADKQGNETKVSCTVK